MKKNVWEKSNDAYSLSITVQTTINHILIWFLPQYQRQRKQSRKQRGMDSYWQQQISQLDFEISSNCG